MNAQINTVTQYNNSFMSPNSALPICGQVLRDVYLNKLVQAKVGVPTLVAAMPVTVSNQITTKTNAGVDLNPNVISTTAIATATNNVSGFSVASPTDMLFPGDEVAASRQTQLAYVALIGCGLEMYLPCDTTLQNVTIGQTLVDWNFTDNLLIKSVATNSIALNIRSNVLDGIRYIIDTTSGAVKMQNVKCIKVQL